MPPISDIASLYDARESQDYQPADGALAERIKRLVFTRQARKLVKGLGFTPESVVDFACGSGLFTTCMANAFSNGTEVAALDFFDTPPRDMDRVRYLPFTRSEELTGQADLVTCFHVLEHDDNPDHMIVRVKELLRPGGHLVIEVPNIDCCWTTVFGRYWDCWYLPYHRTHFSHKSLHSLLERHGFLIKHEEAVCTPSMGRTLSNITKRANSLPFLLAGAALYPFQWIGEGLTLRPSSWRFTAKLRS